MAENPPQIISCPTCGKKSRLYYAGLDYADYVCPVCSIVRAFRTTPLNVRTFESGATRSPLGNKPQYEGYLNPLVIKRFGEYMLKHQTDSAGNRRDADNWQLGMGRDSHIDSKMRHDLDLWLHHRGFADRADESLEDSLCAIMFNTMGYLLDVLKHG